MSKVDRFWCDEARNIRCVREADYDALLAERDALRKDAERYRWLRNRALQVSFSAPAIMMVNGSCEPVSTHAWRSALSGNDADAAIDAALQGEQP